MISNRLRLLGGALLALAVIALGGLTALASGGAPTAETEHHSGLGRTSVTLNASVNPNGTEVTECDFEYGTSEGSLTSTAPCSYSPGSLETPVPVEATVTGLPETTSYFYRIHAKSAAGESNGEIRRFTTLPTAPVANTEKAQNVARTSASLRGFVTPDDAEVTECYFEYGTVPGELTERAACTPEPGSGSEPVEVRANVSGLAESTDYYYRVVATNSFATENGGRTNFETLPSKPSVNPEPAQEEGRTTVRLHGFVNPNGALVEHCFFEWGTASPEEHTTPCEPLEVGSGEAPVAVSAQLSGLGESTTYRFKLIAENSLGVSPTGTGLTFTTLPSLPKMLNQRPVELSDAQATLRAKVDPQGVAVTECRFEYGTTPALGKTASCSALPGSGESYVPVSATVTGLSPTTSYLERVRTANAFGVNYSREEGFTTFQAGLLPIVSGLKPKKGSPEGGNIVTIKGQNLSGATAVSFGETVTTDITSDSPDVLTVVAPPGVGTVDVLVTTASGESALSSADHYTYKNPIITSVEPGHGPVGGGTSVTVDGFGFEPGGTTFTFGKVPATSVECSSSTSCTMLTPPAAKGKAGVAKVQARVAGKGSKASVGATFTYEL